jgi:uncharacterized protein YodC (DUF2158 family)
MSLKVGDVVKLKSGGPLVTVSSIVPGKDTTTTFCRCIYMTNKGGIVEINVPEAALKVEVGP